MKKILTTLLLTLSLAFGATDTMTVSSDGTVNPRNVVFKFPTEFDANASLQGTGFICLTNGVDGSMTNFLSAVRILQRAGDSRYLTFVSTNNAAIPAFFTGNGTGTTIQWRTTTGNADITLNQDTAQVNLLAGAYQFDAGGLSANANGSFTGTFNVTGITTLGNALYSTNPAITNTFSTVAIYPRSPIGEHIVFYGDGNGTSIGMIRTNAHAGFTIATTNSGGFLAFRSSIGLLLSSNFNFEVAGGNAALDGNVTFGLASTNTATFNFSTLTAPNTLNLNSSTFWVTNGSCAINTNSVAATAAFVIQANAATQVPLTLRGQTSQSAANLQILNNAGTTLFTIDSSGAIVRLGGSASATLSAVTFQGINNGGPFSLQNNTGVAQSSLFLAGGTANTDWVQIGNNLGYLFQNSGLKVKSALSSTNYQLNINDYYIAFNPNQAGTTITCTFPAASLSVTNGTTFVVYDAGNALLTNIVLTPTSPNTVNGAASKSMNLKGQKATVTFMNGDWQATSGTTL